MPRHTIQDVPYSCSFGSTSLVNSRITVPNSFNPTTSSFTLLARLFLNQRDILGHWLWSQSTNTIFGVTSSTALGGKFGIVIGGSGGSVIEFASNVDACKWYSLALTFDHVANNWNLYVNGVLDSVTANCDVASRTTNHWIGMHGALGSYGLKGKIVGWHLLKRIATSEECQAWCYSGIKPTGDYDHSYDFAEEEGTTLADSSGNGYTATLGSLVSWSSNRPYLVRRTVVRDQQNTLYFNGASSNGAVAEIASSTYLDNIFDDGGTFECWMKCGLGYGGVNNGKVFSTTVWNVGHNTTNWRLSHGFSGTAGGFRWYSRVMNIFDGWHCFVVTYNNSDVTNLPLGYLDGLLQNQVTLTVPVGTKTSDAGGAKYIGNTNVYTGTFEGNLAQFRFYDRILTRAEIEALYFEGIKPTDGSLLAEFLMNEGSGITLTDTQHGIVANFGGAVPPDWSTDSFSKARTVATSRQIATGRVAV